MLKTQHIPQFPVFQKNKSHFSLNEGGTLRTLHGITGENSVVAPSEADSNPRHEEEEVIHMSKDIFLKRPKQQDDNGILRLKMDVFRVTPSGGLFQSSIDPNISLYFPANAVSQAIAVTMQVCLKISLLLIILSKNG